MTMSTLTSAARFVCIAVVVALATSLASCGGAGGGAGPDGSGQGLKLMSFQQASVDSVSLNEVLVFLFSEAVDPSSVTNASLQIREGPTYGVTVAGEFRVLGSRVEFRPRLPGLCDRSDAGFKSSTTYRVMCVGSPEEFGITNTHGQKLDRTQTNTFTTRIDTDPALFIDAVPATGALVTSSSPVDGDAAVSVAQGNQIVLEIDQNLDPCSINSDNILFFQYETGDPGTFLTAPNGNDTGFDSITDMSPDPYSWGATNSTPTFPPQRIPADIELVQDFDSTRIVITPLQGEFPDNALLVVELTNNVLDFGGQFANPFRISFTTENRPPSNGVFTIDYDGDVDVNKEQTTADVDSARSPGRAQGYLVFSGDGDNGADQLLPSLPETPASGCTVPRQLNDGTADDFDPGSDVLLDTGASLNTCPNLTDGSVGVVWEFQSFRIRAGITVRIVGSNPAIILSQGDVQIDAGGRLLARGDNQGGSPRSDGLTGNSTYGVPTGRAGGVGVAGGGNGGKTYNADNSVKIGEHGTDGFGSPDYGVTGGTASGHGNVNSTLLQHNTGPTINSGAGGGGGAATAGEDGGSNFTPGTTATKFEGTPDGAGGNVVDDGDNSKRLLLPFAGSGGGGAGAAYSSYTDERASGGSGGAGGGFVDITSSGNILVFGTIDAAGGRGGDGINSPWGQEHQSSGGGGGSGGGIRLLTPAELNVSGGTITAAGGAGGIGAVGTVYPGPRNNGGAGGSGHIVLEDADSVITGLAGATISPADGQDGFYRGIFDASRFKGGGLEPKAQTSWFYVGPLDPTYVVPGQTYGGQTDFEAGCPTLASRGVGATCTLVEVRGYDIQPDGTPDLTTPTGWYTVGYFVDSGVENQPNWIPNAQPPDVLPPGGPNAGAGIANVNGKGALEVRTTFYLPTGMGAQDPGPYIGRWDIRFTYDQ